MTEKCNDWKRNETPTCVEGASSNSTDKRGWDVPSKTPRTVKKWCHLRLVKQFNNEFIVQLALELMHFYLVAYLFKISTCVLSLFFLWKWNDVCLESVTRQCIMYSSCFHHGYFPLIVFLCNRRRWRHWKNKLLVETHWYSFSAYDITRPNIFTVDQHRINQFLAESGTGNMGCLQMCGRSH